MKLIKKLFFIHLFKDRVVGLLILIGKRRFLISMPKLIVLNKKCKCFLTSVKDFYNYFFIFGKCNIDLRVN